MRPADDVIEITLIGPGYGECLLAHLGHGNWIVVDSCIDHATGFPAALSYLKSIGVQASTDVQLIVASHWHDDHIRGLAETLRRCERANFCCSNAMTSDEFIAAVSNYQRRNMLAGRSGVREMYEVYHILSERPDRLRYAIANRCVLKIDDLVADYGSACRVFSLSPSDVQVKKFFDELANLIPAPSDTKRRAVPQTPNRTSTVIWVAIGELSLLFGGDLEETAEEETGWSVIVKSNERPGGQASVFKVPHHGSSNGHNQGVWEDMLMDHPYAILCPYNRGRKKLPSAQDLTRITERTANAYITSRVSKARSSRRRSASVERTVRETVKRIWEAEPAAGRVTLRNGGSEAPTSWRVELSPPAVPLSEIRGR